MHRLGEIIYLHTYTLNLIIILILFTGNFGSILDGFAGSSVTPKNIAVAFYSAFFTYGGRYVSTL